MRAHRSYRLVEYIQIEGKVTDVKSIPMRREQIKRVFLRWLSEKAMRVVPSTTMAELIEDGHPFGVALADLLCRRST